jgi:abhydrolase domain-containing protein 1/3
VTFTYKYYKNKRVKIICKETATNKDIIHSVIQKKVKKYRPTFYLPFSFMKSALNADRKVNKYLYQLPFLDVYLRHELELSDHHRIYLDWYPKTFKRMDPKTPIVFFVPGVFGTSEDYYSYQFCKTLHERLGWRSFVFNRRLFMDNFIGPKFISYFNYSDWREVLEYTKSNFPEADIYMVGVSMGALNIQKYLISFKDDPRVKAAVTISSPFNAGATSDVIAKNFFLNKIILQNQLMVFRKHLHNESYLEFLKLKNINIDAVLKCKTNREFDQRCSIRDLEMSSPSDYYSMLSSSSAIKDISIPVLSVNSEDDLLIPPTNVPMAAIQQNPNIIQLMVAGGGHIEYFTGLNCEFVISFLHSGHTL